MWGILLIVSLMLEPPAVHIIPCRAGFGGRRRREEEKGGGLCDWVSSTLEGPSTQGE